MKGMAEDMTGYRVQTEEKMKLMQEQLMRAQTMAEAAVARQEEGLGCDLDHKHFDQGRLDPVEVLVEAMTAGDRHSRSGEWSAALGRYHEAIGALTSSTAPTLAAKVRAAASIAQRKLGSLRSALRHADGAVTACESEACAHAARGAALERLEAKLSLELALRYRELSRAVGACEMCAVPRSEK